MKFLLITDTHGKLGVINELAERAGVDAVIHAGDFGFYDDESVSRLSERELTLSIVHSDLPAHEKAASFELSREEKSELVRSRCRLSELPDYLRGERRFSVPVYAVWGNHEDLHVLEKFRSREYRIPKLEILDERASFHVGRFHIFGLGGNCLRGRKLFQRPLAGAGGKVWSTLSQYADLQRMVDRNARDDEVRLFVTHVSPGKEPLMARLGAHVRADWMVSGHMAPPVCMTWNEFAIRELPESVRWLSTGTDAIRDIWQDIKPGLESDSFLDALEHGMRMVESLPQQNARDVESGLPPRWYRDMFFVSLPDADVGYALLTETDGRVRLDAHSHGR